MKLLFELNHNGNGTLTIDDVSVAKVANCVVTCEHLVDTPDERLHLINEAPVSVFTLKGDLHSSRTWLR